MKKIAIIGPGGSGKSTLAKSLGNTLQLPVYHLDALYWHPNWVRTEKQQWVEIQQDLVSKSHWIIDGNYRSTLDLRLDRADTIIFLDINRFTCLYRAVKRIATQRRGKHRTDMAEGCDEKIDFNFLQWIFNYPNKQKPEVLIKLSKLEKNADVYLFKNQTQTNSFLTSLQLHKQG